MYWSEGSGDNKRTYSSSEDYINESLVMFGKGRHSVHNHVSNALHEYFSSFNYSCSGCAVIAILSCILSLHEMSLIVSPSLVKVKIS